MVIRYCSGGKPNGAGSHTLYGSVDTKGNPMEMDVAFVAAHMQEVLLRTGNCYFRMK